MNRLIQKKEQIVLHMTYYESNNADETFELAQKLGRMAQPGQVYALDGESGIYELSVDGRNTVKIAKASGKLKYYYVTKAAVARDDWLFVSCSGIDGPSRLLVFDLMASALKPVN